MGRKPSQWSLTRCCFCASIVILGLIGVGNAAKEQPGQTGRESERSGNSIHNKCANTAHADENSGLGESSFLLVSTMDGKVSALNLEKQGQMEWAVNAGAMPLLSSSISKLELMRGSVPTRIVPSLDGGLFQLNRDTIEALPFTADTLMSSSFKLNQDSTIVGGRESITYGVEVRTGKIRYICTVDGCTKFDPETKTDTEEVIVLTRHTKTVRAVEMRTGMEKWNFSVGQHAVSTVPRPEDLNHLAMGGDTNHAEKDEHQDIHSCGAEPYEEEEPTEEEEEDWFEYLRTTMFPDKEATFYDLDLKVIVPQGLVVAMSKSEPGRILWKYKFPTAIANAWTLFKGFVHEVNLFDENVVPALVDDELDTGDSAQAHISPEPLLYIGVHKEQLYVQPSVRLSQAVQGSVTHQTTPLNTAVSMPRVRWHPYIATAPSRTPVMSVRHPPQVGYEQPEDPGDVGHSLTLWQDKYPFDAGWYIMSDTSPVAVGPLPDDSDNITSIYAVTESLWNWWREVLAISLVTSVVVHLLLVKFFPRTVEVSELSASNTASNGSETSSKEVSNSEPVSSSSDNSETKEREYISRFLTEFEARHCLGRGGFGVVFEAVNKMDDCAYAIKRITLSNSERAREKVMREVKALAKLDHPGIVRYYQAWLENPPAGWQAKQDSMTFDMPSATATPVGTVTTAPPRGGLRNDTPGGTTTGFVEQQLRGNRTAAAAAAAPESNQPQQNGLLFGAGDADNPLKIANNDLDRWGSSNQTISSISADDLPQLKKAGGSGGFTPSVDLTMSGLENTSSGSNDPWLPVIDKPTEEDSFSIEFKNSHSGNVSKATDTPFSHYDRQDTDDPFDGDTNDSFNIVFGDSGCGMKSAPGANSADNSTDKTHDTACTDLDADLSVSNNSPSKLSRSPGQCTATRPDTLNVIHSDQFGMLSDSSKNFVDPLAPNLYLYIQMQLCQRESLKDWLNSHTVSRDRREVLDIFDQIVAAVDYIHDMGLMHRDLKPSNIFFSMDGTVKVGDFGLVTTQDQEHLTPANHSPKHSVQHTGQVGTKLYMSPEQASGRTYNQKVDIYSLGLIFFELWHPFATQMERTKTLLEVRSNKLPQTFCRKLPVESTFVRSLLDANPERRPGTKEIQQNALLRDFEEARQTISLVRPRTRTTSSSGSGASLSSSH